MQFVWQAALTDAADYLEHSADDSPVAIGGWSPATMDPPTMYLSMRRRGLDTRFFGSDSTAAAVSTIILPARDRLADGQTDLTGPEIRLVRPATRELASGLEAQLNHWGASAQNFDTFVLYELPAIPQLQSDLAVDVTFSDQLQLVDYKSPENLSDCDQEGCRILTYWRVLAPVEEPRRFFLHAVDGDGKLVAQHDGLDAPAQFWQEGDLLVQEHLLPPVIGEDIELRLGVYDPQSGRRLLLSDGGDSYTLHKP